MKKIDPSAQIAQTAIIHDNVEIGKNVVIKDFTVIYPNTIIDDNVEIWENCVIGKVPTSPGCTAREIKETFPPLRIHENSILCPGVVLYSGVEIGRNTLLGDYCSIREECSVGDYSLLSRNVSVNYNTKIGHHTKVMDNTHITGNMYVGNHVFISTLVATTNDNKIGREGYEEDKIKGPTIHDYATIGAAANLLPGVDIGENAIVGAGSVVTKDVAPDTVVMGIPAKFVKYVK